MAQQIRCASRRLSEERIATRSDTYLELVEFCVVQNTVFIGVTEFEDALESLNTSWFEYLGMVSVP